MTQKITKQKTEGKTSINKLKFGQMEIIARRAGESFTTVYKILSETKKLMEDDE